VYEGADSFAGKMKDTARHAYDAVRYGGAHYAKEKVEDAKAGSRDAAIGASRTFRDKVHNHLASKDCVVALAYMCR